MEVTQEASASREARTQLGDVRRQRKALLVAGVIAVLALALGLRMYGLDWDEGFSYTPHPDERFILSKVAEVSPPAPTELGKLLDPDESTWNPYRVAPHKFPYGTFPLYLLKGVELTYELVSGGDLRDLRLLGRALSALADVATVATVFLLGSRIYGRRVGILASALLAMAVIHIQLSHFFTVDTFLAMFAVVTMYFLVRVAQEGRLRDSMMAGGFMGLGLATKASIEPIFAAFWIAHLMYAFSVLQGSNAPPRPFGKRWPAALWGLAAGATVYGVVLFITHPYAFLDFWRYYDDFIEQSEMVRRIRDYPYTRQYIDTAPYWYHIRQLATWGLGWPLGVVAWAGLLFASLRGMRLGYGLSYLGLGWGLPIAALLYSTGFIAIVAASAIALAALLATLPFRSRESRTDVLLLSWVVPYFLMIGAFDVKFLRYLLPITPFLLLFGSRMLLSLWETAVDYRPSLQPWLLAAGVLLVGSTAFYALSYMSVYREPHTAVRASEWFHENVPARSVVLKEHWEESLPEMYRYEVRELHPYDYDRITPSKFLVMAHQLASADYLVFFSNRLYGTIPRLPESYPTTRQFYRLLFAGQLGYELVRVEASYPKLLGTTFMDDTFRRPGVPEPVELRELRRSPLTLDLGFADESFSVYDHPKVLIFQNTGRLDESRLGRIIEGATPYAPVQGPSEDGEMGLMLSPEAAEAQRRGGTWNDIIRADSWTNRVPVLAWLLFVEGIALLALPIALVVFRPLPDRGFLFSKALGLLAVGLVVWLLASARWMAFSRESIAVALLALALVSALTLARYRHELIGFARERWRLLVIGEVIFLAAFFSFVLVRMANPDLWHPFRGGEKPMELAYLHAVLRSSYMPPYDPWFGGGYLNYYYWGQFIVSTLIRGTGIDTAVAFNLAVPLFFALTVAGAFSVVYNLAEATRLRLRFSGQGGDGPRRTENGRLAWSPVVAGLGGALFVTVLGNLDGAVQVGHGVWRVVFQDMPFGQFDFWQSSRMMPPDPPGFEITEFPFFTFLFADLHAHLMAMPFTLLVLGLALAVVLGAIGTGSRRAVWSLDEAVRLAVLGLAIGALWVINAWDFPTYLLVGVGSVFLAEYFVHGGLGLVVIARAGLKSLLVFAVGYLAFLPFHLNYESFFNSVDPTTNTTVLWQFLAISGLFIFIISSFFIKESADWLAAARRGWTRRGPNAIQADSGAGAGALARASDQPQVRWPAVLGLVTLLVAGGVSTAVFYDVIGSTIPFVAALLAIVSAVGVRWLFSSRADAPHLAFLALLVGVSLALVIGLDVVRVEGDIDRMNSVFKFYLQVWVMLALASAYLLWRMAHTKRVPWLRLGLGKKAWLAALGVLILSASIYPVLGAQDRLRDRFNGRVLPLTLDGAAYVEGTIYRDARGEVDLEADFEGIRWLRENLEGSPTVLEAVTPTYRWGGRVSIYTGLPTVIGWEWHQEQQRWDYRRAVGQRIGHVNYIYNSRLRSDALPLLRKYGVEYIYVGPLERLYYGAGGLEKFERMVGSDLDKVYETGQVTIYRLRDGGF